VIFKMDDNFELCDNYHFAIAAAFGAQDLKAR
jgi:hypothetical protein